MTDASEQPIPEKVRGTAHAFRTLLRSASQLVKLLAAGTDLYDKISPHLHAIATPLGHLVRVVFGL